MIFENIEKARQAYALSVDIFNLFNRINRDKFTVLEKHESVKENIHNLYNDKMVLISLLGDEVMDTYYYELAERLLIRVKSF